MMDDASPLDIQRLVNATRIAIANIHSAADVAACAPAGRAVRETPRMGNNPLEKREHDDPDARCGRNEDGSPRTHEQYCATVKQVLFEVYAPKSVKEAAAREAAAKQNPDNPPLASVPPPDSDSPQSSEISDGTSLLIPESAPAPISEVPAPRNSHVPVDDLRSCDPGAPGAHREQIDRDRPVEDSRGHTENPRSPAYLRSSIEDPPRHLLGPQRPMGPPPKPRLVHTLEDDDSRPCSRW
jgi:hypothetical protein